jgi:hypothetical protein
MAALAMKVYGHLRMAYLQKRLQNLRFNADAAQPQAMLPSSGLKSNIEATDAVRTPRVVGDGACRATIGNA